MIRKVKGTDFEKMLKFAQERIGEYTLDIIEAYATKHRIGTARAGKAFWALADDGIFEIIWEPTSEGIKLRLAKVSA